MKVGDLTLNEIKEICTEREGCDGCFLYKPCCKYYCCDISPNEWESEYLEREVEDGERNSTV